MKNSDKRPLRVLIVGQLPKEVGGNYTTGVANVVYELSKQKPSGVVFYIYGTNIADTKAKQLCSFPNQYSGYNICPLRIVWNFLRHPMSSIRHIKHYLNVDHQNCFRYLFHEDNIRATIRCIHPDLIHVNSIMNISPTKFALGSDKIPILLTCHGIFYRGDKNDKVNRDRNLGNIKLADAYSGLTKESLNEFESILGIPRCKVEVIPNGVDCKKFFYSSLERKNVRDEMKIQEAQIVFITVASVQKRKGQLDFLKLISKSHLNYQYWIIGKGAGEDSILDFIQQNNLQDKVKLLGYKTSDELFRYYSAADIYVHSSWKEGQALSELEANATGLRTIVNKAIVDTIANEITSDDYYVLDFENSNIVSLFSWVLNDSQKRASRSTLDWSVITDQYVRLYHKIVEN